MHISYDVLKETILTKPEELNWLTYLLLQKESDDKKLDISEVRNNLKKLSEKFHIILIVDELDRCLPEYAIKVLERLHHICNEMPVIQILAINKRNFADSISSVFGKKFYKSQYSFELTNQFAESYLQKFVDTIIPLPNGHPDSQLEILNGLEKKYRTYIRQDNIGQPFINLDDDFLADFISAVMNGVERRLQEKIFKQVELCHNLTIQSGIKYGKEQMTYAILIYEVISCIGRYVFHSDISFRVRESSSRQCYILSIYQADGISKNVYESEHDIINSNIERFFSTPTHYSNSPNGSQFLPFEIHDTKSYIMAFFATKPKYEFVTFKSNVWDWITEDKVFLQRFDEIMNMITAK